MSAGRDGRIVTFYSYKGGTGRTMALANTAWILAANGKRVLAVDWDLEAPGLHRFFHPFLDPATLGATTGVIDLITEYAWAATSPVQRPDDWHRDYARIQPHAVSLTPESLGWEFPRGGTLDFVSAGRQNREYSATVSTFDWDNFYDRFGGGHFFDALRDDMKAHYDYVLIDSRTGLSDIADICTVHLPDVLVDCFTLSDQSIDGAASVARQIAERNTGRPISVYPVPMRIDEGEKEKADAGRALARLKFDRLPRNLTGDELTAYWGAVEIPYRPYYAYEETLATFGDEAGLTNSLLSAFERLTAVVTDREVTSMPPVGEEVRLRIRDAFTRRRPALPADLHLSYVAENRMWADWLESVLTRAGFRVVARDVTADRPPEERPEPAPENAARTVVLLSSAYLKSQRAVELWQRTAAEAVGGGHRRLVPLRVGDVRLSSPYIDRNPVDLFRLDEVHATTAVMRALDRPVQITDGVPPGPRFPGTVPKIWNAPPRNPGFTGRSLVLERMRDQLGGGLAVVLPQPQTLYGLGGVGKTQVALEYVHRFMADYDLVWWISSEQPDDVVASLAELAARLGAQGGDDMAAASKEAVDLLRRGVPTDRWLLVFDNADDPERLRRYFPQGGSGHILVTSRNQSWSQHGDALPVDVFLREESVEHLQRRAPGLSDEDADQVATAVGDLPLAVEQAAAWIAETATPIGAYLEQLALQAPQVLALNQPAGYPQPVAATWNISIARLKERSPAAVRLLQLCAFFAPEPISANLLYSKEMIDALKPYDSSLQEKLVLGRVIREIGRFALAKVDQVSNSVQVHRLVQAVIKAQLSEEEQREARHVVHRILAGARPDDDEPIDNPETWPRFATIWPHLGPSDARNCKEPETRRLLIDRVRYLWKRGDTRTAWALGEELREIWREELGERDLQYLYLCFHLSNILRTRGRYVEARELDEFTLERQREVLGPEHPPHVHDHQQPGHRPRSARGVRPGHRDGDRGPRGVRADLPRLASADPGGRQQPGAEPAQRRPVRPRPGDRPGRLRSAQPGARPGAPLQPLLRHEPGARPAGGRPVRGLGGAAHHGVRQFQADDGPHLPRDAQRREEPRGVAAPGGAAGGRAPAHGGDPRPLPGEVHHGQPRVAGLRSQPGGRPVRGGRERRGAGHGAGGRGPVHEGAGGEAPVHAGGAEQPRRLSDGGRGAGGGGAGAETGRRLDAGGVRPGAPQHAVLRHEPGQRDGRPGRAGHRAGDRAATGRATARGARGTPPRDAGDDLEHGGHAGLHGPGGRGGAAAVGAGRRAGAPAR